MRQSVNNVEPIYEDKIFRGIALGFDFCAEHECGIKKLSAKSKPIDKPGYKKATVNPFTIVKETDDFVAFSTLDNFVKPEYDKYMNGVISMWDEANVQIIFNKSFCTHNNLIELFKEMVVKCDYTYCWQSFGLGTSLCILKYSAIPKDEIKSIEEESKALKKAEEKFHNSKAFKALIKAKEEFISSKKYHANNFSNETPFDYYALSVRNSKGNIWLNPSHQSYLESNWITENDILDWVKGIPGKIIKDKDSWEYLNWELSSCAWTVMYEKEFYSGIKPKRLHHNDLIKNFKGKLTEEKLNSIYDMIDAHVKNEVFYFLNDFWNTRSIENGKVVTSPLPDTHWPKDEHSGKPLLPLIQNKCSNAQNELNGIMYGIGDIGKALGIFDRDGACNTPRVKSNWNWWHTVLIHEAEYQFWVTMNLIPEKYQKR